APTARLPRGRARSPGRVARGRSGWCSPDSARGCPGGGSARRAAGSRFTRLMSSGRCCAKKTCPSLPRGECASGKSAGRERRSLSRPPLTRGSSRLVEEGPRFYDENMSAIALPGGVVHDLPEDLARALLASTTAQAAWEDITPLARNEFICWVEDAKRQQTRERRIRRTVERSSMTVCAGPAAGRAALTASVPRGNSRAETIPARDRKSTRLNSSHVSISYAVFCLKKKKTSELVYN